MLINVFKLVLIFEGINQEVASGQWEFQLFAKGAKKAGDEIWIARYLIRSFNREIQLLY